MFNIFREFYNDPFFRDDFFILPLAHSSHDQHPSNQVAQRDQHPATNSSVSNSHWPRLDIVAKDKEFHVVCEVPGIKKQDIKVELTQTPDGSKFLTVSGERVDHTTKEDKERGFYSERRNFGSFRRSLQVPDYVTQESIRASHEDGVLTLVLPRQEEAKKEPQTSSIMIQ